MPFIVRRRFLLGVCVAMCLGCGDATAVKPPRDQSVAAPVSEDENTPEAVYRRLMLANLRGDQAEIRQLIVDHRDADLLWQGAYPDEVAAMLAEQYETMTITRPDPSTDAADRVNLESTALPIVLTVVNVAGVWKVDAGPIIEFRKSANESK